MQIIENLEIQHETLLNDLHIVLEEQTVQELEIVLSKMLHTKLQVNAERLENIKCLEETVSQSQTLAEIVWLVLQLDLEKTRARFDNTEDLIVETQKCQRRINLMKNLESRNDLIITEMNQNFESKISEIFGNSKILKSPKNCIKEFEKFNRMLKYSLKSLANENHYSSINDILMKIQENVDILEPFVNNSPIRKPIAENIKFINEIFNTKIDISKMEDLYKSIRMDFQKLSSNMVKLFIYLFYFK